MHCCTRHRLALITMMFVVFAAIPVDTAAVAAQPRPAVTDPEAAAVFYSQLESEGRFADLYTYLHPDAQAIIPEAAVVGWYADHFAPLGPGVITVTGVGIVSWTWDVTGQTYPNTAEVSFQQPFANGTVADEVVRLVEHAGEWRWFFGRSREFVDEQIARYARQGLPASEPSAQSASNSRALTPSSVELRPGESATFRREAQTQTEAPTLELIVPADLQIVGRPTCSAPALVVPVGQGNERARSEGLSCGGAWEYLPDEDAYQMFVTASPTAHPPIAHSISLEVEVQVPLSAKPGTVYTLRAPYAHGLRGEEATATIEVLSHDGRPAAALQTPTSAESEIDMPTFIPSSESPLHVGRTEVTWTTNWQHDPSFLSVPGVTLSHVDMNAGVINVAHIGATAGNDTVETKADAFNFYIRQFTEPGSTVLKTGVGALENGGMWMTFILFYQGVHVTLMITVSEGYEEGFEVEALMANTADFGAAVERARSEIRLDGQLRFLFGVDLTQEPHGTDAETGTLSAVQEDLPAGAERFGTGTLRCEDSGCSPVGGVTIHYESVDGSIQGSCVTEINWTPNGPGAWCFYYQIPGVASTLTLDTSTLPDGWVVRSENPQIYTVPERPLDLLGDVLFHVGPG